MRLVALGVLVLVPTLWGHPSSAALLDPTFGVGGRVRDGSMGSGTSVVVEPGTGRIFVVTGPGFSGDTARLAAFLPDGSPDVTFGTNGRVVIGFTTKVTRQPLDGKLLFISGGALHRYDTNGNLDAAFGNGGEAVIPVPYSKRAVLAQPDGKIVVGGGDAQGSEQAILRLLADGTPDPGFGVNGLVTLPGPYSIDALAPGAGDTLVAGGFDYSSATYLFWLARFLSDGSVDGSFGTGGMVQTDFPANEYARVNELVTQVDGSLVAVGSAIFPGHSGWSAAVLAAARYLPDGTLDATYGTGGTMVATRPLDSTSAIFDDTRAAVADGDGVVVALGNAVGRLTADGRLDPTFAPCRLSFTSKRGAGSVARQEDGKLVVVGEGRAFDFAMDRYTPGISGCQPAAPRRSQIVLRAESPKNPTLRWKWRSSDAVSIADFGSPVADDAFTACLLEEDGSGVQAKVLMEPGAHWKAIPSGFKAKIHLNHLSGSPLPDYNVRLLAGAAGKASIALTAKQGSTGGWAELPYAAPLVVRFERNGVSVCWEARFSTPRSAPGFVATSD